MQRLKIFQQKNFPVPCILTIDGWLYLMCHVCHVATHQTTWSTWTGTGPRTRTQSTSPSGSGEIHFFSYFLADILSRLQSTRDYSASLAHRANHSFRRLCEVRTSGVRTDLPWGQESQEDCQRGGDLCKLQILALSRAALVHNDDQWFRIKI